MNLCEQNNGALLSDWQFMFMAQNGGRRASLGVVAVAVQYGRRQTGLDGQLDVAVDADGREVAGARGRRRRQGHHGRRVETAAARDRRRGGAGGGGGTVRLAVHVERQLATVDVEEDSDDAAGGDAAVRARRVNARVNEPAARVVDVHAPAAAVAACIIIIIIIIIDICKVA